MEISPTNHLPACAAAIARAPTSWQHDGAMQAARHRMAADAREICLDSADVISYTRLAPTTGATARRFGGMPR